MALRIPHIARHPRRSFSVLLFSNRSLVSALLRVIVPMVVVAAVALATLHMILFGEWRFWETLVFFVGGPFPKPLVTSWLSTMPTPPWWSDGLRVIGAHDIWSFSAHGVRFLLPPLLVAVIVNYAIHPAKVFGAAKRIFLQKTDDGYRLCLRAYNSSPFVVIGSHFSANIRIGRTKGGVRSGAPGILSTRVKLIRGNKSVHDKAAWMDEVRYSLCMPRVPIKIFIPLKDGDVEELEEGPRLVAVRGKPISGDDVTLGAFLVFSVIGNFRRVGAEFAETHEYALHDARYQDQVVAGDPAELVPDPRARAARTSEQASRWVGWKWFDSTEQEQKMDPSFRVQLTKWDKLYPGLAEHFAIDEPPVDAAVQQANEADVE